MSAFDDQFLLAALHKYVAACGGNADKCSPYDERELETVLDLYFPIDSPQNHCAECDRSCDCALRNVP